MNNEIPLILASTSPRRQQLLQMANYSFSVQKPTCTEEVDNLPPAETVLSLAMRKAKSVAKHCCSRNWVLGADTIVVLKNCILGKPDDADSAVSMLERLQGQTHSVYTGIYLTDTKSGAFLNHCEHTLVHICSMTNKEISAYVATGDPLDKAGSYGIQGAFASYVSRIEGDYYNVVGFPLHGFHVMWNEARRCWPRD